MDEKRRAAAHGDPPACPRTAPAARRAGLALVAVVGVLFAAVPAQAARRRPATSAEAAELVAARGHELEVVTEQFNEAREALTAQQAAAEAAAAQLEQATAALRAAQQQVRGIARTAYTGEGLELLPGADDQRLRRRVRRPDVARCSSSPATRTASSTRPPPPTSPPPRPRPPRRRPPPRRRRQYDAVAAQQADLQKQIAEYQAVYDRLSAQEQQAAAAAHAGDRASRSAEREPVRRPAGPVVANSAAAQIAIDTAMAQRGKPYVWAAAGPGLVRLLGPDRLRLRAPPGSACRTPAACSRRWARRCPATSSSPATWSSSTARSATWASTSATARWSTRRPPATSSRWPRRLMGGFSRGAGASPADRTPAPTGAPAASWRPGLRSRPGVDVRSQNREHCSRNRAADLTEVGMTQVWNWTLADGGLPRPSSAALAALGRLGLVGRRVDGGHACCSPSAAAGGRRPCCGACSPRRRRRCRWPRSASLVKVRRLRLRPSWRWWPPVTRGWRCSSARPPS